MAQNQIIRITQGYWRAFSLPVKIAIFASIVVGLAVIFSSIAGGIQKQRYENEKSRLEAAARNAETNAADYLGRAEQAHQKVAALEIELKTVNQHLLDLNAELQEANRQTIITRKVYVASKEAPSSVVPLSGDLSADAERVVSKLRSLGH